LTALKLRALLLAISLSSVFPALLMYSQGISAATPECQGPPPRTHTEEFQFSHSLEHDTLASDIPAGSIIGSIRLRRLSVFNLEDPVEDIWLYRLANDFHRTTRESVIFSQLLIAEGDEFKLTRLDESERILRELQFIYDATVRPWRVCGSVVDVEVITRDTWTFAPTVGFSRSGGENSYAIGVTESNFLGTGKQITLEAVGDEERSGVLFIYDDPAVLDSRWKMRVGLRKNDDGFDRNLLLFRPFFSVYEKKSAGVYLRQFELEEKTWFRGNEASEFDHQGELYRIFGGVAKNVRENHRVGRWLFGYQRETNAFDFSELQALQQQAEDQAWNDLFDDDPVDLRFLGKPALIKKARYIIARIEAGAPYTEFRGKRMQYDRTVISVPLNHDFRMIYHQNKSRLQLVDLMGHEQYNVKKPGARV